jgi:hypothetical protein
VPNGESTGVPAGTVLTVHEGDLVVTTPGAVIDSLEIRGSLSVRAPNVTVRNTIIRGATGGQRALPSMIEMRNAPGLTVVDSEIAPTVLGQGAYGIIGSDFTLTRVEIRNVLDSVHLIGGNVTVEDSWLHDNTHIEKDPLWGGGPSHDDSIQIQVGSNIRISGNRIDGAYNAAMMVTQDREKVSDVVFSGNYVNGGACSINFAEKGRGPFRGIVVADNVFGLDTRNPRCAIIAPGSTSIDLRNNVFTDGRPVSVTPG